MLKRIASLILTIAMASLWSVSIMAESTSQEQSVPLADESVQIEQSVAEQTETGESQLRPEVSSVADSSESIKPETTQQAPADVITEQPPAPVELPEELMIPAEAGNDSWPQAQQIALNSVISAKSISNNDDDWYKFTLPVKGAVSISWYNEFNSSSTSWLWSIAPAGPAGPGADIYEQRVYTNSTQHHSIAVGLEAGTYFIKVAPSWSNKLAYSFSANYTASQNWETEQNNSWASANAVNLNTRISCSTTKTDDDDWFKFTLPKRGAISLSFYNAFENNSANNWKWNIFPSKPGGYENSSYKSVYISPVSTEHHTIKIGMDAGTYYFWVDPNYVKDVEYSFSINYMENPSWETEHNNNWSTANTILPDQRTYGSLAYSNDDDWFKLNLSSPASFNFNFQVSPVSASTSNNLILKAYKAVSGGVGQEVLKTQYLGMNVANHNVKMDFPSGSYYIKISPLLKYDVEYNFSLVTLKPLKSIKLDKKTLTLPIKSSHKLKVVSCSPSNTSSSKKATWTSSNKKVATVSSSGTVVAKGYGTARITCTVSGVKAVCTVKVVNPVKVSSVSLNKKSVTVKLNKSYKLVAKVSPSNATNKEVTWKSSNKNNVSVSSSGTIKGLRKGSAVITATTKDGRKIATCRVKVVK